MAELLAELSALSESFPPLARGGQLCVRLRLDASGETEAAPDEAREQAAREASRERFVGAAAPSVQTRRQTGVNSTDGAAHKPWSLCELSHCLTLAIFSCSGLSSLI